MRHEFLHMKGKMAHKAVTSRWGQQGRRGAAWHAREAGRHMAASWQAHAPFCLTCVRATVQSPVRLFLHYLPSQHSGDHHIESAVGAGGRTSIPPQWRQKSKAGQPTPWHIQVPSVTKMNLIAKGG